mgnify:CR=1 FL=1
MADLVLLHHPLGAALLALEVDARLFPYDPAHQTFVNVYEGGNLAQQWILTDGSGSRDLESDALRYQLRDLHRRLAAAVRLVAPEAAE